MNFFKLYIGDYQRDTAHLSVTEHGAYQLMLQHYYATEKPLPEGKALHRMLRAQEKTERDAIDAVAAQFWVATEAGLVNARADAEITKASAQADTNARIAREREEKRKAPREEHVQSTNRATNDQPNQTPDTRHQKEKETTEPAALVAGTAYRPPPAPNAEIVELYRQVLPSLPGVEVLNDSRKRAIAARWREVCAEGKLDREAGLEWFSWYFAHVGKSKFLLGQMPGRSGRTWQADFDFLMTPTKFAKVVEGSYHKDAA